MCSYVRVFPAAMHSNCSANCLPLVDSMNQQSRNYRADNVQGDALMHINALNEANGKP